jgi:diacylglycerol kinase family enzyme
MRALLVVNPKATTTSERGRDVLVRALRSEVELTVANTRRRGHAATLAAEATRDGIDVVVTLGGDGTVNEAVNGILRAKPSADAADRPALAVVPGGSTNVFARAIGLPKDWADGTGVILEALRDSPAGPRCRTIGLGRADDRYFTFCAGLGLDAAVVRRVERARLRGRRSTLNLYVRAAFAQYFLETEWRAHAITLERADEPAEADLATVVVQNTAPWTYLGDRPVNPSPAASFETGLDLMAMRALNPPSTARAVAQILSRRPDPRGKRILRLHDLAGFTLRATRPIGFQVDGEFLGERDKVEFAAVPTALRVVC